LIPISSATVGLLEEPAPVDTTKLVHKQPRIFGVLGGDMGKAIELLRTGEVRTKPLVSHRFPLESAPEAFETQVRADEAVKVMVRV